MKNKFLVIIIGVLFIVGIFLFFSDIEFFKELREKAFDLLNEVVDEEEDTNNVLVDDDILEVYFLDVGQAESILINSQGEYMLIDAGNNKDGKKLVNYLNSLNIKEFKHVVGTHAHEDHIGGMDNIINNFKINNFYMPDVETTTKTFLDVLTSLEKKNITFKTPKIGTKLKLGNSTVEVLYIGNDIENINDNSIVLRLVYKDTSFLFMADASSDVEKQLLNKSIESDVLKVGHHGSTYSSSAEFLNIVKPKYAVIMCGKNNDYYYPHEGVLKRLAKVNAKIYRTDELGTIVAKSDGKNIEFTNIETDLDGV